MKPCPFCAEEIQDAAIVCRHCGKDLKPIPNTKNTAAGCAGIGLIALLGIGWCTSAMPTFEAPQEPVTAPSPQATPNAIQRPEQIEPAGVSDGVAQQINARVRAKCQRDWPTDFNVRAFCERQQREAFVKLANRNMDTSADRITIRRKCAGDWPDDFNVRNFCEEQQLGALDELSR